MVLQNGENTLLTVGQIAAHLHTRDWNVTRELQLGQRDRLAGRTTGRLRGNKVLGAGVGAGGQWRVDPEVYLSWLGVGAEDRAEHLGPDGLPELIPFAQAAEKLGIPADELRHRVRVERHAHITFGRKRYLTHNQLERLRVQLIEDVREATPGDREPDAVP